MKEMSPSALPLLCLVLGACTAPIDQDRLRQGNHSAPTNLQHSEDCPGGNAEGECQVTITYPPTEEVEP